jgi:hypothetical protein
MDGKVLYKGQQINNVSMGMSSLGINIRWQPKTSMPKIEGIDLLTNYSGFALADGGYKGITLNLHTKTAIKISGFLMSNWVMESIMPSVSL